MNSVYMCVCLMVIISVIDVGYALKCIKCEAQAEHSCKKDSPRRGVVPCGLEHPEFYYFCLKKISKDKVTNKSKVTYGCELIGRYAVLRIIPQCKNNNESLEEVISCQACITDLCEFDDNVSIANPSTITLPLGFSLMFLLVNSMLR